MTGGLKGAVKVDAAERKRVQKAKKEGKRWARSGGGGGGGEERRREMVERLMEKFLLVLWRRILHQASTSR